MEIYSGKTLSQANLSNHLVQKIKDLVTDLPPRPHLGWQNCHSILICQTRRLLENRKIVVSKPFVHTKVAKFLKQNAIVLRKIHFFHAEGQGISTYISTKGGYYVKDIIDEENSYCIQ